MTAHAEELERSYYQLMALSKEDSNLFRCNSYFITHDHVGS